MPKKTIITPTQQGNGFTLVELMVAMFLSGVLILGALQVFDSTRQGTQVQTALSSVQDSGRIAMEFLNRDLRNASFSGCLQNKTRIQNLIDTGSTNYNASVHQYYNLGDVTGVASASSLEIAGFDADGNSITAEVIDGTSTISVVGARPACDGVSAIDSSAADEASPLTLRGSCPIEAGTVLLVSNCYYADIFVKTNAASASTIEHATVVADGMQNTSANFQTTYKADSQVLVPYVRQYFIAPGSNGNNSLYRWEDGVIRELVINVEDFDITYGEDNDDDGAVDLFAATPVDMTLVTSVRASITVRSEGNVDGAPLNRTYTSTTGIRNRIATSEADPDA